MKSNPLLKEYGILVMGGCLLIAFLTINSTDGKLIGYFEPNVSKYITYGALILAFITYYNYKNSANELYNENLRMKEDAEWNRNQRHPQQPQYQEPFQQPQYYPQQQRYSAPPQYPEPPQYKPPQQPFQTPPVVPEYHPPQQQPTLQGKL